MKNPALNTKQLEKTVLWLL